MKIRTLRHLSKEGILGIWENRLMSLASIGTIVLCLIILGVSFTLASNVDYILSQIESNVGITAYIDDSVKEDEITTLKTKLEAIPNVSGVTYVSKDDAFLTFTDDSNLENIMKQFEKDNPLPASFEITMVDLEEQERVIESLEQYDELEISYFQAEAPMLVQLNDSIRYISMIIIISLILVGIILMSNTIKLTVYIRRREINIMKYIGATDWFIRAPFIIEGISIGLIGGIIPIFALWGAYSWVLKVVNSRFTVMIESIKLQSTADILSAFTPMSLIIGVGIGAIGSIISIRKHLKV
ncbi:MAG: FtsX-like permease family protein [Epulopiscium sp.]|nr:FtsX-like permease family protein [Candidatus Epulonipiscium sp.]